MVLYKYYLELCSFIKTQLWKKYLSVWLFEWLIGWVVVILFLIQYPFTLILDTFLEFRDCVKSLSILSYQAWANLFGEFFYLGSEVFHEEINLPPSHENDCWCLELVDLEEHSKGCSDGVCPYSISLDTHVLLAYCFHRALEWFHY